MRGGFLIGSEEDFANGNDVPGFVGTHPHGAVLSNGRLKGKVCGDQLQ